MSKALSVCSLCAGKPFAPHPVHAPHAGQSSVWPTQNLVTGNVAHVSRQHPCFCCEQYDSQGDGQLLTNYMTHAQWKNHVLLLHAE